MRYRLRSLPATLASLNDEQFVFWSNKEKITEKEREIEQECSINLSAGLPHLLSFALLTCLHSPLPVPPRPSHSPRPRPRPPTPLVFAQAGFLHATQSKWDWEKKYFQL